MPRAALVAAMCLLLALLGPGCGRDDNQTTFSAAPLSGSNQVPARTTAATGDASFTAEGTAVSFSLELRRISGVTAVHLHSGTPGGHGPLRVDLYPGPVTGAVSGTLADDTFTEGDVRGLTLGQLLDQMASGAAYVDVHTTAFPDGELRAQLRREQ